MKMKNPLIVVKDMEKSKAFYREVLGLRVISDLGANAVLSGGLALQSEESWNAFISEEISFGGNDSEIYFEEDNFDDFAERLQKINGIEYVHPVKEHSWGQRVVRFYDLDKHIIEVGENMKFVCKRFADSGMTAEEIAGRMDVPVKMVNLYLR